MPVVRIAEVGRGSAHCGAGIGNLTAIAGADALLRAVFEAAVTVARDGEEAEPLVRAPSALRPYLQFTRLEQRVALNAVRRVLERDPEFRARVAEVVTEEAVGRAGWLFVARPPGWEDEFDALVERRAEIDLRRRVERAESDLRRAEKVAATARAQEAAAVIAAADERRARHAVEEQIREASRRLDELSRERDDAGKAADAAHAETESLRSEVAGLRREIERLASELEQRDHLLAAGAVTPPPVASASTAVTDAVNRRAAESLEAAARVVSDLAGDLVATARALAGNDAAGPAGPAGRDPTSGSPSNIALEKVAPATGEGRQATAHAGGLRAPAWRRSPVPLPPAVLEDSVEAAEYLVRLPGAVLLVDGYNVSHAGWPEVSIAEQRRRLCDALAELTARTGADANVVFDGSDLAMMPVVPTTARSVKIAFSPPGTEADDVLISRVAGVAANRPVVVVSSDRRVRDGARDGGANVISSGQLLAVLRR